VFCSIKFEVALAEIDAVTKINLTFELLFWLILSTVAESESAVNTTKLKVNIAINENNEIIPTPVLAIGFALEQPLRDVTLARLASGISKQLEYISRILNMLNFG
jgi:hypothetical protein